jgi:hypothetical protein
LFALITSGRPPGNFTRHMSQYHTRTKKIQDLTDDDLVRMSGLFLSHYDACTQAQMRADLKTKCEALLLFHNSEMVGFTTLQVYEQQWAGRQIRIVYSGDTVVDHRHWGQQALAFSWISHIRNIRDEKPMLPLYWFVIIKGHRTFKYLSTFAKSFYPHWSLERLDLKPLADQLAREKFGDRYNCNTGIVEYDRSQGHLKNGISLPGSHDMNKAPVRFFVTRNPDYLIGHELVCICELEENNMKPFTRRIFRKAGDANALAKTA